MKNQNKENQNMMLIALITLAAMALIFLFGFRPKESFIAQPYTVQSGDSLDKLYYEFGSGNLEKWRYEVKKLNGMEESGLYAGDEIIILVHKDDGKWK